MDDVRCIDIIQPQRLYLRLIEIWPQKRQTSVSWLIYIMVLATSIGYVFSLVMELFKDISERNYPKLSTHLSLLFPTSLYNIKIVILKWKRKEFLNLLEETNVSAFEPISEHAKSCVGKAITRSRFLTVFFVSAVALTILQTNALMFIGNAGSQFRFSYDVGEYDKAVEIIRCLNLLQIAISNTYLDTLAVAFISIASTQLDILNEKIRSCRNVPNAGLGAVLKECVVLHNAIDEYVRCTESLFSATFFSQFLCSIFAICNIGFQIVHVSQLPLPKKN